ncbi:MAG: hypothetical protein K2G63_03365 [Oscillospiraceae bacterium]|nr:hypothetical protein [Oscillospiraceae bacterium]
MYTSIQEADAYIIIHYTSGSSEYKRWKSLSDDDKNVYLTNAFEAIEKLQFRGRKAVPGQDTAFPRLPYQYGKVDEIAPLCVKSAEIELALWISDEKKQSRLQKRKELIENGVTSFSLGDLSENYGDTTKSEVKTVSALKCEKCRELLAPYLCGGYEMC